MEAAAKLEDLEKEVQDLRGRRLTGIIKKAGNYYVALCLELNVSSQGESIEEAKGMLQEACEEYLSYIKEEKLENEIRPAPLEVLREFLIENVEHVRPFY